MGLSIGDYLNRDGSEKYDGRTVFSDISLSDYLNHYGYIIGRPKAMKKFRPIYKIERKYRVVVRVSLVQRVAGVELDHYRREYDVGYLYFVTTRRDNQRNIIKRRVIKDSGVSFYDTQDVEMLGGARELLG